MTTTESDDVRIARLEERLDALVDRDAERAAALARIEHDVADLLKWSQHLRGSIAGVGVVLMAIGGVVTIAAEHVVQWIARRLGLA